MATKKGPAHALDDVRACAVRRAVEFMETSAKAPLRDHFGSNRAGLAAACQVLASLSADDFVETVVLDTTQEPADVYAVRLDERDWYVKLYLTVDIEPPHDDATVCVSFHPPRFPMTTIAGRKVTT